ncbi:MAG TPA: zf-HC2 domain-containing protein [Gemmatimonadales bacterium]|nr:zf-HC2 domain-containing protein [Gemmatimonadales bacterium]
MTDHAHWAQQIDAELDDELTLAERAALAHHLTSCPACAGARASHLELRAALARAAGQPQARTVPRPVLGTRRLVAWLAAAATAGAALGWLANAHWGAPGSLRWEASRAAFVVE